MRLGISYNVFSGLELLEPSIRAIIDEVDFVNIVYQDISNKGNKKPEIHNFMQTLNYTGLVDKFVHFKPSLAIQPKELETRKRNIGLNVCRSADCTHFMSMDADEFYNIEQFRAAKKLIEDKGYKTTACQMQTYYKTIEYRVTPPEDYYVPFIHSIDDRRFHKGLPWPVVADPSRKVDPINFYAFKREELEMHHLSYIRDDIRDKLFNSSSSVNYGDRLEEIARHHDNWAYPQQAYLGGSKKRLMDIEKIKPPFEL